MHHDTHTNTDEDVLQRFFVKALGMSAVTSPGGPTVRKGLWIRQQPTRQRPSPSPVNRSAYFHSWWKSSHGGWQEATWEAGLCHAKSSTNSPMKFMGWLKCCIVKSVMYQMISLHSFAQLLGKRHKPHKTPASSDPSQGWMTIGWTIIRPIIHWLFHYLGYQYRLLIRKYSLRIIDSYKARKLPNSVLLT